MEGADNYKRQRHVFHGTLNQKGRVPFRESALLESSTHANDKSETQDVDMKRKLWLLRSSYVRILTSQKANNQFESCREIGLDFDVGSGAKRALNLDLLTNGVLMAVHQFATAINKGLVRFLSDILERNFNIFLHKNLSTETLVRNLIMKKKVLLTHPDRERFEFLNGILHLPDIYDKAKEVESTKSTSSSNDMEEYPFCKKIGVDFWTTDDNKLPLSTLTVGALLEMFFFVDVLCSTTLDLVKDILEHNFKLDLQSSDSEAVAVFQKWYAGVFQKCSSTEKWFVRRPNTLPRDMWLNTPVFTQTKSEDPLTGCDDFRACKKIGLDLDVASKRKAKRKLSLQQLTRGVLIEVHRYVQQNHLHYVPSLYRILDYNFNLVYQKQHKVEFAWSLASQVLAMSRKSHRSDKYLNTVFELPFQCAGVEEPQEEEVLHQMDPGDKDIVFIQKLEPDIVVVQIE
nr:uncharacterized protein LOC125982344 [Syngnathus scovelli]